MKRLFRLSLLHVLLIVGLFAMVLSVFANLNQRFSVRHANHIALAVSRNGKQVAAGISTMPVRIWDSSSNEPMASLEGHTRSVQGVAFTENGRQLISVSYDNSIRLWDLETQHELTRIDAGQGPVGSVSLSSDEALLATGGGDGSIKLWDRVTGNEIANLSGPTARVTRLAFSPDNAWLASIDFDGSVRVWDVEQQRVAWSHPKADAAQVFGDIAFSADGILAIARHHTAKLELREMPSGNLIGPCERSRCQCGHRHHLSGDRATRGRVVCALGRWHGRYPGERRDPVRRCGRGAGRRRSAGSLLAMPTWAPHR